MMKFFFMMSVLLLNSSLSQAEYLHFETADKGVVYADFYPAGDHSTVILAHGAIFDRNSWDGLLNALQKKHLSVLAIDFRGYGDSHAPDLINKYEDILAAVHFLRQQKKQQEIYILGASMGGAAAAQASIKAKPGEIQKLVLLSPAPFQSAERLKGPLLVIASQDEPMKNLIAELYRQAPQPKQLVWLPGHAHAQHILKTEQKAALIQQIVDFLRPDF